MLDFVLIDFENVLSDAVRHEGIIFKLIKCGFQYPLILLIKSYSSNRQFYKI